MKTRKDTEMTLTKFDKSEEDDYSMKEDWSEEESIEALSPLPKTMTKVLSTETNKSNTQQKWSTISNQGSMCVEKEGGLIGVVEERDDEESNVSSLNQTL